MEKISLAGMEKIDLLIMLEYSNVSRSNATLATVNAKRLYNAHISTPKVANKREDSDLHMLEIFFGKGKRV